MVVRRFENKRMNKTLSLYIIQKWPYVTLEVIFHFLKNLCLHNFRILSNSYNNRFINECAVKDLAKIP